MSGKLVLLVAACLAGICWGDSAGSCEYDDVKPQARRMVCRHVTCEQDLHEELKTIKRFNVEELVLESSSFRFFKHDSFSGTKFRVITLRDSSIMALTDTHIAFSGLEDRLEKLVVEDGSFVSQWDWNHLRNLRKLHTLTVRGSDLVYLSESLTNVSSSSLERVQFPYNEITWIHDDAFSSFTEMTYLMLDYNEITGLVRSMFPRETNKLQTLNLRHNLIETLPADIFTDMPNLKSVVLDENLLTTIDENVFGGIWSQLLLLQINDCALRCDCRLNWILERESGPRLLYSRCDEPHRLRRRLLFNLKKEDLFC